MPFTPLIPVDGLAGWSFLKTTLPRQTEFFNSSPDIQRDIAYFEEHMPNVSTLDDLMGDRRLLKVALGAFGLQDEINKGAFVRKVLSDGTDDQSDFAVRLNNSNYLAFAEEIAVGEDGGINISSESISNMATQYERQSFEIELGNVNQNMRLALNFEREIEDLSNQNLTEAGGWFRVMGSTPLRSVIEAAFNLPSEFSALDIDRQKDILADKSQQLFGGSSIEVFQDSENVETLIRQFLLREGLNSGPTASTPGFAALSLLSGGIGSGGIASLLLSNS